MGNASCPSPLLAIFPGRAVPSFPTSAPSFSWAPGGQGMALYFSLGPCQPSFREIRRPLSGPPPGQTEMLTITLWGVDCTFLVVKSAQLVKPQ